MEIWGWGWDPDGRVIGATLVIDGETRATIRYGDPRPEQCVDLPAVSRCPNIGFAGEIDTRQLTNGPHIVGVRLFDDRGASALVAGPNRSGVNIVVDNR